jgi:hypothetical protein
MAKTALSALQVRVGYEFQITPSATTSPTLDEITSWLNEAQNDIARIMPANMLRELLVIENPSIAAVSEYALSSFVNTFVKFHSATLNIDGVSTDTPAVLVTPLQAAFRNTTELMGVEASPIVWFEESKIKWSPATTGGAATGKLKVTYIKLPTALSGASDTTSLAQEYEDALVLFAISRGKEQDEEFQQAMAFKQDYLRNLQNIHKGWS